MASQPDTTLFWCLECLSAAPQVPYTALFDLMDKVNMGASSESPFPAVLNCRLILSGLLNTEAVTSDTQRSLELLKQLVENNRGELGHISSHDIVPSSHLLLQVRPVLGVASICGLPRRRRRSRFFAFFACRPRHNPSFLPVRSYPHPRR